MREVQSLKPACGRQVQSSKSTACLFRKRFKKIYPFFDFQLKIMITTKKISLYKKYEGEGDRFLRSAWPWQRNSISPDEWQMIEQSIQDIKLMDRGLASDSYKEALLEKIKANCENEKTIAELR